MTQDTPIRARSGAAPAHSGSWEDSYGDLVAALSDASVKRNFDPYLDIDWDSDEFAIDTKDPRWVLPDFDPLGTHPWYKALPLERRIEIGLWRQANTVKVITAFESILVRGLMQHIMRLPNGSPEFRYCVHEMIEECNHIQMFQELVNRMHADVPGMKPYFRMLAPFLGLVAGPFRILFFICILAGEVPLDHIQKSFLRGDADVSPALRRIMAIHVAEEARHISFAHEFLREHVAKATRLGRVYYSFAFPLAMRWLANVYLVPPRSLARKLGLPRKVMRGAFWRDPASRKILSDYFADVRMLATELGLMNPVGRLSWRLLRVDGPASRYRGEPRR